MITANRQYPMPHKDHVVLDDIGKLRVAFAMIEVDILEAENKIDETASIISDLENRVVRASSAVENSEIQGIAPNRYIIANESGSGFECIDGGGDSGGKTGQCSIKKSDDNFDTIWGNILEVSSKGMTVQQNSEMSKPNQTHIYMSNAETENAEQLPRTDLGNQQIVGDTFAESESYILRDFIEQIAETPEIATRANFGLVKIGAGLNDDNGKISIDGYGFASKTEFGLVKIGDGIDEQDAEISIPTIEIATTTTFGVVKLGADFSLNANDEIETAKTGDEEMVIYDIAKMKIVTNGIVNLEENIATYRAFLNEDLMFSFNIGFEPTADFSFILEIISDAEHIVSFDASVPSSLSPLGVNRGVTKIKFTKLLGSSKWNAEVNLLEAPEPILLTPNYGDSVQSNLILSCNGSNWDAGSMMGTDVGNIGFYNSPREIYFDFAKSAVVDSVYFYNSISNVMSLFELLGSNDKIHWTRLLYKANSVIERNTATKKKGAFHYFKLRFSSEANVRGIQLQGSIIDNNDSELILLTPSMGSDSLAGITISCSNLRGNSLRDVTSSSANSCIEVDKGSYDEPWIQYEFAEPKIANFLDLASHQDETHRTARWFKLLASNDGETWDLLLERQYQEDWKQCETRYFELENTTAYKFYRLVCSYTSDGNNPFIWRISRFRLFRRESGTSSFVNCLPPLIAADQERYEISANSEADSGHVAVNAFDENDDTKWATQSGDHLNSWLKIKFPEAIACNAVYLQTRNDSYYYQAPSLFKIQASNDDSTWIDMIYESASWTQKEEKFFYWFNETPYLYYRLLIESVQSGSNAGLAKFELGRRAKTYHRHLIQYNYLTPAMTSNSQNGFIASASSEYNGNEGAWRCFDRSGGQWTTVNGTRQNVELKIQLPTPASCDKISITGSNAPSRCPSTFYVQGSNDGTNWTNLVDQTTPLSWGSSETKTWENPVDTAFLYYRMYVLTNNGDEFLSVQEFALIKETIIQEY